jgi:hypothetical protein
MQKLEKKQLSKEASNLRGQTTKNDGPPYQTEQHWALAPRLPVFLLPSPKGGFFVRSMTTRQTAKLFSWAFLIMALALVQAQAKSDFSGTWKLNTGKSDFGAMPPPDTMTQKITHQDPSLKASVASTGGMNGDMSYDMSYTTDGKECVNKVGESEFKSTLKWDGDDLMVDTKGSFGGNEFTAKGRWTLSGDGKILTVTQHFTSAMGEGDIKEVFEKQ